MDMYNEDPDRPWDIDCLFDRLSITCTWDQVRDNLEEPWDWHRLSIENDNITWDIIQENLDMTWCWHALSMRKDLTWDFIKEHRDWPWDWDQLITKAGVRLDVLGVHLPANPSWVCLMSNLEICSEADILKRIKEHMATRVIQEKWRRCISDPEYSICRKRLLEEYQEFDINETI